MHYPDSRQLMQVVNVESCNSETHRPEMADHLILFCVAPIIRVFLPIIDIDLGDTANQQLKLTFIEDVNQIWWDQLIETGNKGVELLFNSFLDTPFGDEP